MKTPVKTSMYCRWAHSYNIYFIPAPVHWTKMSLIKWCVWLQYGGERQWMFTKAVWMQHSQESKPWTGVHPVWYKILPDSSIYLFCTVRVGYTQFTRLTKNNYQMYNENPKMAVSQKLYPHCLWPGVPPPPPVPDVNLHLVLGRFKCARRPGFSVRLASLVRESPFTA